MYGVIVDSIEIVLLGGTIQILNSYLGVERFILSVVSLHPKSRIVAQAAPGNLYLHGFALHRATRLVTRHSNRIYQN